jgi:O-antigen ligase
MQATQPNEGNPRELRKNLEFLSLSAILIFVGTGLYTQFPSVAYIPIMFAVVLLLSNRRFVRAPHRYIEPNMFKGFAIFNVFLLLQIVFSRLELHAFFFQFFAISLMVLTYALVKFIADEKGFAYLSIFKQLGVVVLLGLMLLLAGQIAQITGYIEQVNYDGADVDVLTTLARPGGFLNPNVTAAIAIVLLFTLDRLSIFINKRFFVAALPLTIAVVLLTQSRAALIALLGILLIILTKHSWRHMIATLLMASVCVFIISIAYPDVATSLIDNVMQRFEGDASSDDRQNMLHNGLNAFSDAPLFGHGSTYLVSKFGVSSHNQLIEILVGYGLLGLSVLAPAFLLLYFPMSALMFALCILPMFLFSHNFFDSGPYQVAVGLALVVDRLASSVVSPTQRPKASHRKLKI